MFKKLISTETKPGAFFRRVDWTAFWGATLIAFLVYFFTLGPSVGLEDSGELATAGDHLGVPHPPGYPFWTLCSWIFCRIFSFVTYRGCPTPAWAISLLSTVFGALAAGCTSMLICRSANDMLDSIEENKEKKESSTALLCLCGGLGASLVFAFSPVMWSQATIVEIYSLNALFLMAVFLLSYRWMRKPSDRVLWLTAFVFGLGLTNYQVLLLAAVPLAIIIALKNIRLFRDFILVCIPVGLTAIVLQVGSMLRASRQMTGEVINKYEPLKETFSCPNEVLLYLALALVVAAPLVGAFIRKRGGNAKKAAMATAFSGVGLMVLAATIFAGKMTWVGQFEESIAPLINPQTYALLGALLAGSVAFAMGAAFAPDDATTLKDKRLLQPLLGAAACALLAIMIVGGFKAADAAGYMGEPFAWGKPICLTLAGLIALFALTCSTPRALAFAIPVAGVQAVAFILLSKGAMNGLTHPSSWWFAWPVVWNFVMITLAAVTLPNGKAIAPTLFFAELGVSFYLYMPLVSDLRNPPMNWGYPRTWEGFKHAITRGQYEAITMTDVFSPRFLQQLGFYFQDLRMQFTLVAAGFALVPFALWKATLGKRKILGSTVATLLYLVMAVMVVVFSELLETTNGEVPLRLDKYLLLILALMALAGLVAMIVRQFSVVISQLRNKPLNNANSRFTFLADDTTQQWLIASGISFAMMSILLIALANTKGDIQDGFIQKVKFISSHGMFSLWIGYGIVITLAVVRRLARPLFVPACVCAVLVAAIPIYENYTNDKLVFAMGSAEQNGHTFGWQFGAYQLRGADAIREELSPDEEPLPNPLYPKEMEPHAVFFGGTDPGRFVPTYMIYSAATRPDIYLITQNALADDTYMSVERDLYGDEIWIPAKEDSAESFNVYVSEVQSGKRDANAALKIENGRVQVTGALGVMEINGILTKMMFDHERLRRAFYIEESYVIKWMYPYLAPHGLIMQIRPDTAPIPQNNITDDMEFWDWYHRRLLRDKAFRRDFPAQKSFSKLRAAIAGLYSNQGRYTQADIAFREAVLLYPASPEASFRCIQEVLAPMHRWAAINDILDYTDSVDPNNGRCQQMRDHIKRIREFTARTEQLQTRERNGSITAPERLRLAECHYALGRVTLAAAQIRKALEAKDLPAELIYSAASMLAQMGQRGDAANAAKRMLTLVGDKMPPEMRHQIAALLADGGMLTEADEQLNICLRANSSDVESWVNLAQVKAMQRDYEGSFAALAQAQYLNPEYTEQRLKASELLQHVVTRHMRQQQQQQRTLPSFK